MKTRRTGRREKSYSGKIYPNAEQERRLLGRWPRSGVLVLLNRIKCFGGEILPYDHFLSEIE